MWIYRHTHTYIYIHNYTYVYVYGRWKLCLLVPRGLIFQNIGGIQLRNDVFLWCCFCRTGLCSSMLAAAESVICRVKEAPHMRYLDGRVLMKGPVEEHSSFQWHMALWEWEIMALWTQLWYVFILAPFGGCNPLIIRIQASRGLQQAYRLCLRRQIGSIRIYPIESERDRHHIIATSVFSRAARQLVVNKTQPEKCLEVLASCSALAILNERNRNFSASHSTSAINNPSWSPSFRSFEVESFGESLGYHSGHAFGCFHCHSIGLL